MLKNYRCFILGSKKYREKGGGVKYYDPCEVRLQQDFRSPPPAGLETLASTLYGQAWIIQSTHKFSWSIVQRHKSSVFNLSPRLKRDTILNWEPIEEVHKTLHTAYFSHLHPSCPFHKLHHNYTIVPLFRVKHKSLSQFEVWTGVRSKECQSSFVLLLFVCFVLLLLVCFVGTVGCRR